MIAFMLAIDWDGVAAIAGVAAVLVAAVSALLSSLSSHRSHQISERLLELESLRDRRAALRLTWRRDHEAAYFIRIVNDGPGVATDVRVQLLDVNDEPWKYGKDVENERHRAEMPSTDVIELKTGQHRSKLWVRVRWEWTDGDGTHKTDEIISHRSRRYYEDTASSDTSPSPGESSTRGGPG